MEQNSCLEFMLSLCLSYTLLLFASWALNFPAATTLPSAHCLCSHLSFSRKVFLVKDSGECLDLTLSSSDDVAKLWSWGPGLNVHTGAHLFCRGESATLPSHWAKSCSSSGETH